MSSIVDANLQEEGEKKSKRVKWYVSDEIALLKIVLAENPFEDDAKWKTVLDTLSALQEKPFTLRNIKDRLSFMLKEFRRDEKIILRKSGSEEEYQEKDVLLEEVSSLQTEFKKPGNKRKDRQRQDEGRAVRDAAAESLRTSETELLSENENLQGDTFFGTTDDNANVFEIICPSPRTYQWSTMIDETTHPSCSTNMDAIPDTTSRSVPLRTSAVLSVANSGAVTAATSAAVPGTSATVPRTTFAALPETTAAETANPETTNVPIRSRKRGGDPIKAQVTRYIQQRNVEDRADRRKALELEEKKIGLEERRLELEERKLRIEEQKMELLLKSSDRRDQTEVVILGIMERLVEKLDKK